MQPTIMMQSIEALSSQNTQDLHQNNTTTMADKVNRIVRTSRNNILSATNNYQTLAFSSISSAQKTDATPSHLASSQQKPPQQNPNPSSNLKTFTITVRPNKRSGSDAPTRKEYPDGVGGFGFNLEENSLKLH